MPKELTEQYKLDIAMKSYQDEIGTEPYQPLESLLNTLKNLCKSFDLNVVSG